MQGRHPRPVGGVIQNLVALKAWLVFILLHALYWSNSYDLFQKIVVTGVHTIDNMGRNCAEMGNLELQAHEAVGQAFIESKAALLPILYRIDEFYRT